MARLANRCAALLTAAFLAAGATAAQAQDYQETLEVAPSAEAMAFDLVLIRPLGVVATAAGLGLFVVSLPFAILTGNISDPAQRLVVEPAKFTFSRQLGSLEN